MRKHFRAISAILCGCFLLAACSQKPADTSSMTDTGETSNISASDDMSSSDAASSQESGTENSSQGGGTAQKPGNSTQGGGTAQKPGNSSQGGGTVKPSPKLPDLKVSVTSNSYKKKAYSWTFDGAGSTIDYFDTLGKVESSKSVKLASGTVGSLGISTCVESTLVIPIRPTAGMMICIGTTAGR